jgi:hypothetical protein
MYIWVGVSPPNSWKLILEMYLRPNWTLISSLTLYQLKEVFIEKFSGRWGIRFYHLVYCFD